MVKVVAISDTHELHRNLKIPDGDILIHCGDITFMGSINEIIDFNEWLGELPHPYKVVIGGNHDITLETQPKVKNLLTNAIYLENSGVEILGKKIWASPFTPAIFNITDDEADGYPWVFSKQRNSGALENIWKQIPEGLDILITHGPPYDILDRNTQNDPCGDGLLLAEVTMKKPKYHLFGHIHEAYGNMVGKNTVFINCAIVNAAYQLFNKPIVFDI